MGAKISKPYSSYKLQQERLVVEQKLSNFGSRGGGGLLYMGYLWLLSVQGQSEVIRYISDFQHHCISKMTGRTAKQTQISASGGTCLVRRGNCDCYLFKVSLKSFGIFPIFFLFSTPFVSKQVLREQTGHKSAPRMYLFSLCGCLC